MKKHTTLLAFLTLMVFFFACKPDVTYFYYDEKDTKILEEYLNLPTEPFDYQVSLPAHLTRAGLFPRPVEFAKATLGRVLFYDKKLSKDGTVACASCHKQELGFADNVAFSRGVSDRSTARNSFALSSVANFSAYYGTDINGGSAIRFFWDNRAETAMDQSRGSLTNSREMDMTMTEVVNAIASQPYYEPLFRKAFNDPYVNEDRVLEAIANFINAMGSFNSKFDDQANNHNGTYQLSSLSYLDDFAGFSASENRGKRVYNTYCASCHSGNFGRPVLQFANNGLDLDTSTDEGVGGITGYAAQMGTFKVPTLRNIDRTAPYMHDGRFKTLEEVIEHYNSGIKAHPNLSESLSVSKGVPLKNFLSPQDKEDLIAFLHTLSDNHLLNDEQFSNPFKQ